MSFEAFNMVDNWSSIGAVAKNSLPYFSAKTYEAESIQENLHMLVQQTKYSKSGLLN